MHFYLVSISRWKFNVDIVANNRIDCDGFVFYAVFFSTPFSLSASVPFNVVSCCFFFRCSSHSFHSIQCELLCLAGVKRSLVFVVGVFFLYSIVSWWNDESMRLLFLLLKHKHMQSVARFTHLLNEKLFGLLRVSIYFTSFALPCHCIGNGFLIHVTEKKRNKPKKRMKKSTQTHTYTLSCTLQWVWTFTKSSQRHELKARWKCERERERKSLHAIRFLWCNCTVPCVRRRIYTL